MKYILQMCSAGMRPAMDRSVVLHVSVTVHCGIFERILYSLYVILNSGLWAGCVERLEYIESFFFFQCCPNNVTWSLTGVWLAAYLQELICRSCQPRRPRNLRRGAASYCVTFCLSTFRRVFRYSLQDIGVNEGGDDGDHHNERTNLQQSRWLALTESPSHNFEW